MNIATLLNSVSPSSESQGGSLRVVLGGRPTTQIHREGSNSPDP